MLNKIEFIKIPLLLFSIIFKDFKIFIKLNHALKIIISKETQIYRLKKELIRFKIIKKKSKIIIIITKCNRL